MARAARARRGRPRSVAIVPYLGYGDAGRVRLRGRVLEGKGSLERAESGSATWRNLVVTLHRFATDEVPGARVRARLGEHRAEAVSDEEGFFEVALDGLALEPNQRWRDLELELLEPRPVRPAPLPARALTPPAAARLGVISDIDDTIIRTGANALLRNWRTILSSSPAPRPASRSAAWPPSTGRSSTGREVVVPR